MRVVCLIQAREGSTRFPKKIYAELGGIPVITRVVRQARQITGVTNVAPIYPDQYPEVNEEDVLGRYAAAAERYDAEVIVRITGDCPFLDPQIGSLLVGKFIYGGTSFDYVSNVYPKRTWPDGMDCEVFSREILFRAHAECKDPVEREHVTPWIQKHSAYFNLMLPVDWSHVRLTLDTPEDLVWLNQCLRAPVSDFSA